MGRAVIGTEVAAALPELRAQARSLMVDEAIVTREGAEPVWDPVTEQMVATTTEIYRGPVRVVGRDRTVAQMVDVASEGVMITPFVVMLPWNATGIKDGDLVTVTASTNPSLIGFRLTVTAAVRASHSVELRLQCDAFS